MELVEDINGDVGFEEGRVWLPTHVLKEALEPKDPSSWPHHRHVYDAKPSLDAVFENQNFFSNSSSKLKSSRSRFRANIATGGPGMQAIFLDSGKKSCGGTGFFLPRNTGSTNFSPSKKPAFSPVLLPARVIEALNLNVYALGSQLTSREDPKKNNHNIRSRNENQDFRNCKKNGREGRDDEVKITESCGPLNSFQSSPEIFLPKDWSY